MSLYGDGDYCSVWEERWVASARKEHVCSACDETIAPGQRYHVTFSVYVGNGRTVKRCARCQAIYGHLSDRIKRESTACGEEFCDAELNCGHEYEERWCEPPPDWLAALAFWRPGDPLPEVPA